MLFMCKVEDEAKVVGEDWDSLMFHNGKLFSGSYANGKVHVWTSDLKHISEFSAHDYPIYAMTPGPGNTFFTSSFDCSIKQWEEEGDNNFRLLATLEGHPEPARRIIFFGGKLYSGDDKGILKIWKDSGCQGSFETMEEIWDLLVSDGEVVTVRHIDVTLFSVTEKDDKMRICVKNSIPGRAPLQYGLGGELLCCADRNDNAINIHQRSTGLPLAGRLQGHSAIINGMASTGNYLVTGGCDNLVVLWNLENFLEYSRVTVDGYVNAITTSPDGRIFVGGENKLLTCLKLC